MKSTPPKGSCPPAIFGGNGPTLTSLIEVSYACRFLPASIVRPLRADALERSTVIVYLHGASRLTPAGHVDFC
jgi:hypothetical protein